MLHALCVYTMADMTTARIYEVEDDDLEARGAAIEASIAARDAAIVAEARAEISRRMPKLTQQQIAYEAFGQKQQWLGRRLNGATPFTPGELIVLGDYLKRNILPWLKAGSPDDPFGGEGSQAYVPDYLEILSGDGQSSAPRKGHLSLISSDFFELPEGLAV